MTTAPRYLAQPQYAHVERVDLCIAAVEYARGDLVEAARILGLKNASLLYFLRKGHQLRRPMPLAVRDALAEALTARALTKAPAW
jgi:hypothetical protein